MTSAMGIVQPIENTPHALSRSELTTTSAMAASATTMTNTIAMLVAAPPEPPRPVAIVPMGEQAEAKALVLARDLRRRGFVVELGYGGNMKKRMQRANKVRARAAIILGEDELSRSAAAVRDLDSGEQAEIALDRLEAHLDRFR